MEHFLEPHRPMNSVRSKTLSYATVIVCEIWYPIPKPGHSSSHYRSKPGHSSSAYKRQR